ncbi:hypothetical protein [Amycolatopsis echigonensis]|uniref:Uncharacterized protein n=1 Tax=Amycolatopsis echigonensis TaxID=2576905 RepID=A0A8E1W1E3_9PSEU|nr:hypothetical protein [Amycolatopsis echigonensis]MBB2502181.1 hypothetical protein [Amycolatopsis echigonensis]
MLDQDPDAVAAEGAARPRSELLDAWHGQDIFDTAGVEHRPTDRLKRIAALGVAGRGLSFYAAQLPLPTEPIRVELTGPDGAVWAWGPDDAAQPIPGQRKGFRLRITQRRTLDETSLAAIGDDART